MPSSAPPTKSRALRAARLLALVAGLPCSLPGFAQVYPSGPVRILVPFTPGGGTDIFARLIAHKLAESWGQPVVIENRPGASGTVGTAVVAKSPPDGHTALIVPAGYAGNPGLYKRLPYDHTRDLAPVSWLASGPLVLVVHPSFPARTTKELIAFARARPGDVDFGSSGPGTLPHLSAELFIAMTGVKMVHVPYRGAGAAAVDLLSGRIPLYFMNILQSIQFVKAGKLRALAVTTPRRSPIAPEVPALAEAGLRGYDMTNWYGLLVPAATPRAAVLKLNAEVTRILKLPDTEKRLAADGMTVVASTPEQFADFLARETQKFTKVIEAAGIKGTM
ncbi:MAG: tripartite tricarboxylate transporter substrate binding protein [Burkholderiales bacterium]|nr:tripartite tricarboxylate transporter substrate binding protein [Burkholderiales bacterium]